MSPKPARDHTALTRRERQIMDILYRRGRATANEVLEDLPGNPHYSTVRRSCACWRRRGTSATRSRGPLRLHAGRPRRAARKSALRHLVDTFFDGSAEQVVAAVLGGEGARLSDEELERIAELVAKAKKEGSR